MSNQIGSVYGKLDLDSTPFIASVERAIKAIERLNSAQRGQQATSLPGLPNTGTQLSALSSIQRGIAGVSNSATTASKSMSLMAGMPLNFSGLAGVVGMAAGIGVLAIGLQKAKEAFDKCIDEASAFEKAMTRTGVVARANTPELKAMTDEALRLGIVTSKTAVDVANAMAIMAKNGASVTEITKGAAADIVMFSEATGASLIESDKAMQAVRNTFAIAQENMAQAINNTTGVLTNSKYEVVDYQHALANGGGAASSFGVSLADFNAVITATASSFAAGGDAGTAFKNMLIYLQPKSAAANRELKSLGIISKDNQNAFYTQSGKLKGMAEVTQILSDATANLTDKEKTASIVRIFGTKSSAMALALLRSNELAARQGANVIDLYNTKLTNTSATRIAQEQMKTYTGSLTILNGTISALAIRAGTPFLTPLTGAITAFNGALVASYSPLVEFIATLQRGFDLVKTVGAGLGGGIAAWAKEQTTSLVQSTRSAIQGIGEMMGFVSKTVTNSVYSAIPETYAIENVTTQLMKSSVAVQLAGDANKKYAEISKTMQTGIEDRTKKIEELVHAQKTDEESLKRMSAAGLGQTKEYKVIELGIKNRTKAISDEQLILKNYTSATQNAKTELSSYTQKLAAAIEQQKRNYTTLAQLERQGKSGTAQFKEMQQSTASNEQTIRSLTATTNDLIARNINLVDASSKLGTSLDTTTDSIEATEEALKALKEITKDGIKSFADLKKENEKFSSAAVSDARKLAKDTAEVSKDAGDKSKESVVKSNQDIAKEEASAQKKLIELDKDTARSRSEVYKDFAATLVDIEKERAQAIIDAVNDISKDGTNALQDSLSGQVDFLDGLIERQNSYNDGIAKIDEESAAKGKENYDKYQKEIGGICEIGGWRRKLVARNAYQKEQQELVEDTRKKKAEAAKSFKEQEEKAALEYAKQQNQQSEHLGRMLIEYTQAQGLIKGLSANSISDMTNALADQYGVQLSLAESSFGKMKGVIDQWALAGGKDVDGYVGSLTDLRDEALAAQQAIDQFLKAKSAELSTQFRAGKISLPDYRKALADLPTEARATVGLKLDVQNIDQSKVGKIDADAAQKELDAKKDTDTKLRDLEVKSSEERAKIIQEKDAAIKEIRTQLAQELAKITEDANKRITEIETAAKEAALLAENEHNNRINEIKQAQGQALVEYTRIKAQQEGLSADQTEAMVDAVCVKYGVLKDTTETSFAAQTKFVDDSCAAIKLGLSSVASVADGLANNLMGITDKFSKTKDEIAVTTDYGKAKVAELTSAIGSLPANTTIGVNVVVDNSQLKETVDLLGKASQATAPDVPGVSPDLRLPTRGTVLARAQGGSIMARQPYLVGEQGAELIVPSSNGFVFTAKETKQMLAGASNSLWRAQGNNSAANPIIPNIGFNINASVDAPPSMSGKQVSAIVNKRIRDSLPAMQAIVVDTLHSLTTDLYNNGLKV